MPVSMPTTEPLDHNRPPWLASLHDRLGAVCGRDNTALIETHISWVILADDFAYKIKKPITLDFLDYGTLDKRRHCCDEEIRLNRRFAPQLYLGVVPIRADSENPRFCGDGPVIEYAVKMKRFEPSALAAQAVDAHAVSVAHVEAFAAQLADIHQHAPRVARGSPYGSMQAIHDAASDNFITLDYLVTADASRSVLHTLRHWTLAQGNAQWPLFLQRQEAGFIRECHGDLHLGNLVLLEGELVAFDGIEFAPALRWIDVMSDVAFLVMDFADRGRSDLAWHFLNVYLSTSGDYEGLEVLRFYLVYRALVRAKVDALRTKQTGGGSNPTCSTLQYLTLAMKFAHPPLPELILMHGLSGSGKSAVAKLIAAALNAVHLRSDVERKRMAGLAAQQHSGAPLRGGIYDSPHTEAVYARLADLARIGLLKGWPVVVDATFLVLAQRDRFWDLAKALQLPCRIIELRATEGELRLRVTRRAQVDSDASEADSHVLDAQLGTLEPLTSSERRNAIVVDTSSVSPAAVAATALDAIQHAQDRLVR